jgi:glycosyltransferase involved in cell wall biosynthesis
MKIGLNLLHAMPEIGGGWNYIANLIAALGLYDPHNSYIAFVTKYSAGLLPKSPNFSRIFIRIDPAHRVQRILYENTLLPLLAKKKRIECLHWFSGTQGLFCSVPSVVTIYDLQAFMLLTKFSPAKRAYLRFMKRRAFEKSNLLLPISSSTAGLLQQAFGVSPKRMVTIPPVLPTVYRPESDEGRERFKKRYSLPDHFWLYVAHMYAHKNHLRLLEAFAELKKDGFPIWPLALRGDPHGSEGDIEEAIIRLDLKKDVVLLPRLEGEEMRGLYSAATALIFPSLYEGSGIPVLEAMACSCAIVASDIPPVRENAGDAAVYFDPQSVASIKRAIVEFQGTSLDSVAERRRRGLERIEPYRPRRVVDKLTDAYESARKDGRAC